MSDTIERPAVRPATRTRIVLHTGKGGVGKTTMSAATALAAARAGHRTLLLSTDPAHSIGDVLDLEIGSDAAPVNGVDGLFAAQVDTRGRFEEAWADIRGYLVGVLAARGVSELQAEELTVLPGADEIIALLEVHRRALEGQFDVIVVDCAPSGESLRLLALPETIRFYADRLMGAPARLMRSLAAGFAGLTGGRASSGPSAAQVSDALTGLLDDLADARAMLADPAVTRIRVVVTPERVVINEARRLLTGLALHGFAVESVLVNRMLPEIAVGGEFMAAWYAAQQACRPLIEESFGRLPLRQVRLSAVEPIGLSMLEDVAAQLFDELDPIPEAAPAPSLRTDGSDGRYRLLIDLPLAERSAVGLSRAGDDLVITIGPLRRRISLPSTLQRCRTVGASFSGDTLVVEFVPDLDRWPAALSEPLTRRSTSPTDHPWSEGRPASQSRSGEPRTGVTADLAGAS
ncbi:arsenite efflux ATP-binding protein ArsA [Nakamurella panacisegetis]|uniref:Arsenite efflux ATP-binding protein ArsA n=1 Tax=Nakamurella panacisegetis TaxID=1090615 RepID=A0A1H0R2I3_9ACTN|nr:ArsA family ATPase [Nakamurella panacisegetis]SDP23743.1 arsenite efflux ATP-binding protein ArsA [Nakamurella panacisegetis]